MSTKNDKIYEQHGIARFFMVAAIERPGDPPFTEEQLREFQPHHRHETHKRALWEAHRLAAKIGRPFTVMRSSTLAFPPEPEPAEPQQPASDPDAPAEAAAECAA